MNSGPVGIVLLLVFLLAATMQSFAQARAVSISNFAFTDSVSNSSTTVIRKGETVQWTWMSGSHSTTSGTCSGACTANNVWDSTIKSSGTFSYTFNQVGNFSYYCRQHGASMTGVVIVRPPAGPFALQITPSNFSLVPAKTLQFTASRVFLRGAASPPAMAENVTNQVQWSSSDTNIAIINPSTGVVTAGSTQGPVTITASKGPLSAVVQLNVSSTVVLNSITVTPANLHVLPGAGPVTYTAIGNYSDGTTQDLTGGATWASSAPGVASMTNNVAALGSAGSTVVSATSGGVTGSTGLQVVVLSSITVTPANQVVVAKSGPVNYTATGNYSDGGTQNFTGTATWGSTNTGVATVASNVATLVGGGNTTISATQGLTGSTNLRVIPVLTVSPPTSTISVLQTQQFTANLPVTWSVDGVGSGNNASGFISASGLYTPTIMSVGPVHTITANTTAALAQTKTASIQVNAPFAGMLTYHNDNARIGLNSNEAILTPANVNMSQFRLLFNIPVDGKVDAQPLYLPALNISGGVHNVLFVATEHDNVYAFDADTGALYWQISMLKAGETTSDSRSCGQVSPEIGVTATPVIDLSMGPNGVIYVVAMSKNGSGTYFQRLHALDLTTGAELLNGPKDVQATYPGTGAGSSSGTVIFDPGQYKERTSLLVLNGKIYTAWASHCDINPYTAWIMAYDEATLAQTSVIDLVPNGSEGAMWNAGAGLAADADGYIYPMTGNGTFDTTLNNGFPNRGDYGNAFVKLATGSGLSVADYFTMSDTVSESNADADLGSGGALLLPDMTDAQAQTRHLITGAGKDGRIYLLDRDNLGKFNANNNNGNAYQVLFNALPGGIWSMPAYFNGNVYFGAVNGPIRAFQFNNARLNALPGSQSAHSFGYPGATPSVSANGTMNAIVWVAENSGTAVLHAYDANNLATELYNSNQAGTRDHFGAGNKFITPTIANGKVYVGTTNSVGVFGEF